MNRRELGAMLRKEALTVLQNFGGNSPVARALWVGTLFSGGVLLPLMIGEFWLMHTSFLIVFPILGGVMVTQNIIDTVAGERERKTLETLLSTPVSSAAVVWGKVLPTVLVAVIISIGNLVLGVITVNLVAWNGHLQLPQTDLLIALPLLSVLFPGLTVSAGFFGSLMARNTRQATQVFTLTLTALLIIPPVAWVLLPGHLTAPLVRWWADLDTSDILAIVLLTLLVLDAIIMTVNLMSFQRRRLNFSG